MTLEWKMYETAGVKKVSAQELEDIFRGVVPPSAPKMNRFLTE
jgi:hypothetical protein